MKHNPSPFKWRHFEPTFILLCVRWYGKYQLSCRDLEEMMNERGLAVDHMTIFRWVQKYAPEINKRRRTYLKLAGASYRRDETYIKVGKQWKYLYRALDKEGQTIEFRLSAKRDMAAVKRFFKKMMRADHRRLPFSISVDKHASYPDAFNSSQIEKVLCEGWQTAEDEVPDQYCRAGPPIHQKEMESHAVLPLLPYSRAGD